MSASEPRRGAFLERQVQAALRADGYWTMKAPGSKGPVDLVAIKRGQILFVQCKLGGYLPPSERRALWAAAQGAGAVPLVVSREKPGVLQWVRMVGPDLAILDMWVRFDIDEMA